MPRVFIDNVVFFEELLSRIQEEGYSTRIIARGNSMLPLLRNQKDELSLSPLSESSIRVGNVLLARIDGRYLVHRIEKIDGDQITLRGDGNPYQREYCERKDLLAEMTCVFRNRTRKIEKGSFLWNLVRYTWFRNPFLRRAFLYILCRL